MKKKMNISTNLPNREDTTPTVDPPMTPPTQKTATIHDQMRTTSLFPCLHSLVSISVESLSTSFMRVVLHPPIHSVMSFWGALRTPVL